MKFRYLEQLGCLVVFEVLITAQLPFLATKLLGHASLECQKVVGKELHQLRRI